MTHGWRGNIGLIVAASDLTVEMDFHAMKPEGVAVYAARVPLSETNNYEEKLRAYDQMSEATPAAARLLADVKPDVIIFCCTAGSVLKGMDTDQELISTIEEQTGIPAITAATAFVQQLKSMGISRADLLTPFTEEFSARVQAFLCGNVPGLEILRCRDLGIVGALPKCRVSPYTIYKEARQLASAEAEALVISCTSFQLLSVQRTIERDLGRPVLSGNTAMMWLALQKLGIGQREDQHERSNRMHHEAS